jgi:hypothetical protein
LATAIQQIEKPITSAGNLCCGLVAGGFVTARSGEGQLRLLE